MAEGISPHFGSYLNLNFDSPACSTVLFEAKCKIGRARS
eukprot:SAG11_NODE_30325_length_302_cov_0.571429_1_plen_38_part_10